MPRKAYKGWDEKNKQWVRMLGGVRHRVTCSALGCQPTKEASCQAAETWFSQVKAAHAEQVKPIPIRIMSPARLQEAQQELTQANAGNVEQLIKLRLQGLNAQPEYVETLPDLNTPQALTIKANLENFLDFVRVGIKPKSFDEIEEKLNQLIKQDFFSGEMAVSQITAATVNAHLHWLDKANMSIGDKIKRLGFFRRFVKWLGANEILENVPKNLALGGWTKPKTKIKTFKNVVDVIKNLPQHKKLWAMLCLNTGMTQADLGKLDWSQINKKNWTLTRERTKLEGQANAPEVTYKLWQETIKLLKAHPIQNGRVFLTSKGTPLYEVKFVDGKLSDKDLFGTYWNRGETPVIPLGKFRSIGSTEITKHNRTVANLFLANTPNGPNEINYSAEDYKEGCDLWLALEAARKSLGVDKLQ